MKQHLRELTMAQFVDLLCGDVKVLEPKGTDDKTVAAVRNTIIFEYSQMADPVSAGRYIHSYSDKAKAKLKVALFKVLSNLMSIGAYDDVRTLLGEYGYRRDYTVEHLMEQVPQMLRSAEADLARLEAEPKGAKTEERTPEDIRNSYDRQCAALMTYFKFHIDMTVMPASQFACMIAQAEREIKAKQLALSKRP